MTGVKRERIPSLWSMGGETALAQSYIYLLSMLTQARIIYILNHVAHNEGILNMCAVSSVPTVGTSSSIEACPLDLATDDLLEADVSKEEMLATLAGVKSKEAVGPGSLLGELFRSSACTILLFAHVHILPSCFSYAKDPIDKSQH